MTTAPTPAANPLLFTSRQAAQMLAISERTLWDLTRRRDIACVRIGRSVRYTVTDLQSYIDGRKALAEGRSANAMDSTRTNP
jgi:excisionase family DNA binding protein